MSKAWKKPKDPEDVADYGLDWSPLIAMGAEEAVNTIVAVTGEVVEGDVVIDSNSVGSVENAPDGQATVHRLSGGTAGTSCLLNFHIVTESGEEFDQGVKLKIKER